MNEHYFTDEWRDEMKADAYVPPKLEFDDFCKANPLGDYATAAAVHILRCDDEQARLMESLGDGVMRYLMRQFGGAEGLPSSYDTDQRVRDELALYDWFARANEWRCIELQREEWERS